MAKYLYELLFRVVPDGSFRAHAIWANRFEVEGEVIERLDDPVAISGTEAKAILGDVCTAQAQEITYLKKTLETQKAELTEYLDGTTNLQDIINRQEQEIADLKAKSAVTKEDLQALQKAVENFK